MSYYALICPGNGSSRISWQSKQSQDLLSFRIIIWNCGSLFIALPICCSELGFLFWPVGLMVTKRYSWISTCLIFVLVVTSMLWKWARVQSVCHMILHWKLVQRITLTWRSNQVSLVNVLLSKDEMSMSIVSERVFFYYFPSFVGTAWLGFFARHGKAKCTRGTVGWCLLSWP